MSRLQALKSQLSPENGTFLGQNTRIRVDLKGCTLILVLFQNGTLRDSVARPPRSLYPLRSSLHDQFMHSCEPLFLEV